MEFQYVRIVSPQGSSNANVRVQNCCPVASGHLRLLRASARDFVFWMFAERSSLAMLSKSNFPVPPTARIRFQNIVAAPYSTNTKFKPLVKLTAYFQRTSNGSPELCREPKITGNIYARTSLDIFHFGKTQQQEKNQTLNSVA